MGKSVDERVAERKQNSLMRWRLREAEKEKLKRAGITFEQSTNAGLVYIRTEFGSVTYKLVTGAWTTRCAESTGEGVESLKKFMEQGDA